MLGTPLPPSPPPKKKKAKNVLTQQNKDKVTKRNLNYKM